jgi:ATP-dependent Clp protease ATP-binding subunit ClpB
MDKLERRLIQIRVEREAVKKEKDELRANGCRRSKKRSSASSVNIRTSRTSGRPRKQVQGSQPRQGRLERLKLEMEAAKRKGDWQQVSEIQLRPHTRARSAVKQAASSEATGGGPAKERRFSSCEVGAEEIAEVVSRMTGIPVSK